MEKTGIVMDKPVSFIQTSFLCRTYTKYSRITM
jgi:hypothetical protein